MKKLESGFDRRRKTLAQVKIQNYLPDVLSPLIFVIAMMPLNHVLRKCTGVYRLNKSQEKINHPMYIDDIKLIAK